MMATLEDLRPIVMKDPEALASYEAEKAILAKEMAEQERERVKSGKEETRVTA